jgi:hypothetical protein
MRRALIAVACVTLLAACAAPRAEEVNTSPEDGWVYVDNLAGLSKGCDGTTLVYHYGGYQGGVAVVPNSPECAP